MKLFLPAMSTRFGTVFAIAFCTTIFTAALHLPASESHAQVRVGAKAPPLVLRLVGQGQYYNLRDHVGRGARFPKKAVVVSFFATWCTPCQKEIPILQRLMDKLACKQLDTVVVGTGRGQSEKHLLAYAREKGLRLRTLADPYRTAANPWKVKNLPATFVVDGAGRVVARFLRARKGFTARLVRVIKKLVRPAATAGTCSATTGPRRPTGGKVKPVVVVKVDTRRADTDDVAELRALVRSSLFSTGRFTLISKAVQDEAMRAQQRSNRACVTSRCQNS